MSQRLDTVVCDCCLQQTDRMWAYRHPAFCFEDSCGSRSTFDPGWWGFCVYCHVLFRRRQLRLLTARVHVLNQHLFPPDLYALYATVAKAVFGESKEWEAGMFYDFPVEVMD
jgi:hypothetical protein